MEALQEILQEFQNNSAPYLDPVEWAESVLSYPDRRTKEPAPLRLAEHQKNALWQAAARGENGDFLYSVVALCWAKGWAKSFTSAIYGLWRAVHFPRQRIFLLANSREQSQSSLLYYMQQLLFSSPKLLRWVGEQNVGETYIHFPNRSRIVGLPCKRGTTAGIRPDVLMNTETHEIADRMVLDQLIMQTDGPNCQVIIDSHAADDDNILADYKERAQTDPRIFFDYLEGREDVQFPWWREGFAQEAKRGLLPFEYERWILNRFGSGERKLFPPHVLEKMFDERVPLHCTREWLLEFMREIGGRGFVVGGGLDRSAPWTQNLRDETVWTSTAKIHCADGPHYVLLTQEVPPLNSEAKLKEIILKGHKEWRYSNCKFESYQAGDIYLWALSKFIPSELCHAQGADQARAFAELHTAAQDGRVHICPQHSQLREQLKTFEAQLQNNKPQFGLLKKAGKYNEYRQRILDDRVYSLAWSVDALIEQNYREVRLRFLGQQED